VVVVSAAEADTRARTAADLLGIAAW